MFKWMYFKVIEFDCFESGYLVKIFFYKNIYNLINSLINNITLIKIYQKLYWILKLIRGNQITANGWTYVSEGRSKLLNLTILN